MVYYSHLHSGINFLTSYQRHYNLDKEVINNRIKIYEKARLKNLERWTKDIRDWSLSEYVSLNPIKDEETEKTIRKQNQE